MDVKDVHHRELKPETCPRRPATIATSSLSSIENDIPRRLIQRGPEAS